MFPSIHSFLSRPSFCLQDQRTRSPIILSHFHGMYRSLRWQQLFSGRQGRRFGWSHGQWSLRNPIHLVIPPISIGTGRSEPGWALRSFPYIHTSWQWGLLWPTQVYIAAPYRSPLNQRSQVLATASCSRSTGHEPVIPINDLVVRFPVLWLCRRPRILSLLFLSRVSRISPSWAGSVSSQPRTRWREGVTYWKRAPIRQDGSTLCTYPYPIPI